jgi:hypothetical protein
MSTTAPAPDLAAPAPAATSTPAAPATDAGVTTFRGRTLEELLPQIREQLGPDAVVVRQRDGLMGGIGGFFQQRFVEVDARAGHARVDVYDDQPEPFAALLAAATDAEPGGPRISTSDRRPDPRSSAAPALPDAEAAAPAPTLANELTASGMSHAFAERLIQDAESHELPFVHAGLREAVRGGVSRLLPSALPHRVGGLAVAFAGPGSTACANALAAAYKRAGRDARALATIERARTRIERGSPDAVLALDLPPIPSDGGELTALAERLEAVELDELLMVLPVDLDLPSAHALLDRLRPLSPTALALVLDVHGAQLGAALELACTTRLPIAYAESAGAIAPADPAALAERLLP